MMKLTPLVLTVGLLFAAMSCGSDDGDVIPDASPGDARTVDSATTDVARADSATTDVRATDSSMADTRTTDAAITDTPTPDMAPIDAATSDSATTDTRTGDSASADVGTADSAIADSRTIDSSISDTSTADLANIDARDSADAQLSDGAPADSTDSDVRSYLVSVTLAGNGLGVVTSNPSGINCGATCAASYPSGTLVTLDAVAAMGSTFAGWTGGGCSGTGTCQIAVTSATPVTATFTLNQYSLTVTPAGNGAGTVTSNPSGISCGSTCSASFNYGQNVTLTAAPSGGSGFTGWSGSGCTGTSPCTVSITAASAVTATFTIQHTLTITKAGNGAGTVTSSPAGISCGATCSAGFNAGENVTLTASPSTGSTFDGWSGSGCTGTAPCVVPITAASSVTASFTLLQYTLTVGTSGAGTGLLTSNPAGIDCGATCSALFNHGTIVSVYASSTTSAFMGWSGSCAGTGACSITMNSSRSVTASFVPPLSCTTSTTVSICSNGASPQINLGPIAPATCHDQCQIAMRQAGMTTGCWIFAGDGNCYCRSGSVSGGGTRNGGFCN